MLHILSNKAEWLAKRDAYMRAARDCRESLVNPARRPVFRDGACFFEGAPVFTPKAANSPDVTSAVRRWVERARYAHAVGMGRVPAIQNLTVINNTEIAKGSLYAE